MRIDDRWGIKAEAKASPGFGSFPLATLYRRAELL
jgi:hypothetical protein